MTAPPQDQKKLVQSRFGQAARAYVTSDIHARGKDLDRLIDMAAPQSDWRILDIATGAGHTAFRLAEKGRFVTALDFTWEMIMSAHPNEHTNINFTMGDAEQLPFANNSFDLVVCRLAAHHFNDCFRFVQECKRVVKPGAAVLIEDHLNPDDPRDSNWLDAFERLRDPGHHRAYNRYEWEGMFLDAGLVVDEVEILQLAAGGVITWAQRQDCTPETIEKLQIMLAHCPATVADFIHPSLPGTPHADFIHNFIFIKGRKPPEGP
ncbi:MAG: class I SAM-dependent methyltransferase [Chloroflexota bacterium]